MLMAKISALAFILCASLTLPALAQESAPISIDLQEVGKRDVTVAITATEGTYFYWDILETPTFEENGGAESIDLSDLEWLSYVASGYEMTLKEALPMLLFQGGYSGLYSEAHGGYLSLDTDYTLYAYGMDLNGKRTTDIYTVDFTTEPRITSLMTVDVQVESIVPDEVNSTATKSLWTATFNLHPSTTEEEYAVLVHPVRFYDQYEDLPQYTWDDYLDMQFTPYIDRAYTGDVQLIYDNIAEEDYYMVVTGWDGGPSTEIYLTRFRGEAYSGVEGVGADEVAPLPAPGGVIIAGAYEFATVYDMEGRVVKSLRGAEYAALQPGVYLVSVTTAEGRSVTAKIRVKK